MGERSLSGAKIAVSFSASVQNKMSVGGAVASGLVSFDKNSVLSIGDADADLAWYWEGTITNGHSVVLRLASMAGWDIGAGDGNDIVGQAWNAVEIVSLIISNENEAGVYGFLEVTPGDTIPVQWIGMHTVSNGGAIGAGGFIVRHEPDAGFPVSAGAQGVRIFANGGDVAVKIVIAARSDSEYSSSSSSSSLTSSSSSTSTSSVSETSSSSSVTSSSSSSSVTSSSSSSSKSSVTSSSSSSSVTSSSSSLSSSSSSSSVTSSSSASGSSSSS